MFYGEFDYKIDDKGRVPVPPKFRDALKEGVILTPGPEGCLTGYTPKEWNRISAQLTGQGLTRAKMRILNRALFSTAFSTKIDNQGRIAIPAPLRGHAGIGEDAVIAGTNTTFEIWDAARWQEEKQASLEQAWQIIETLENNQ
jgi:MraZ protein